MAAAGYRAPCQRRGGSPGPGQEALRPQGAGAVDPQGSGPSAGLHLPRRGPQEASLLCGGLLGGGLAVGPSSRLCH